MSNVIEIKLHEDLGSALKNKLRYKIELGIWKAKYRKAKAENDYDMLDVLDRSY